MYNSLSFDITLVNRSNLLTLFFLVGLFHFLFFLDMTSLLGITDHIQQQTSTTTESWNETKSINSPSLVLLHLIIKRHQPSSWNNKTTNDSISFYHRNIYDNTMTNGITMNSLSFSSSHLIWFEIFLLHLHSQHRFLNRLSYLMNDDDNKQHHSTKQDGNDMEFIVISFSI